MGSFLTIVNDTQDPWLCKIGPDEAALQIASIVIAVVGTAAAAITTAGAAAAPLAAFLTTNNVIAVSGVTASALTTVGTGAAAVATYASVAGGVSGFGIGMAKVLADQLNKDGFHTLEPDGRYQSAKMTLSLWQQGTCVKTVIVDETTLRMETLYMRPIFTGATDNSNLDHDISFWLNKWGTEKQDIVAQDGARRALQAQTHGKLRGAGPADDAMPETNASHGNRT